MRNNHWRIFLTLTALSAFTACLPGCLISGSSDTTHTGTSVASTTFEQIKPNITTIGWVHATLGEPSNKTNDGGDEVWKFTYTERTDTTGAVFLVFGGSSTTEKTNTVFIEFKDGIVINKWRG